MILHTIAHVVRKVHFNQSVLEAKYQICEFCHNRYSILFVKKKNNTFAKLRHICTYLPFMQNESVTTNFLNKFQTAFFSHEGEKANTWIPRSYEPKTSWCGNFFTKIQLEVSEGKWDQKWWFRRQGSCWEGFTGWTIQEQIAGNGCGKIIYLGNKSFF